MIGTRSKLGSEEEIDHQSIANDQKKEENKLRMWCKCWSLRVRRVSERYFLKLILLFLEKYFMNYGGEKFGKNIEVFILKFLRRK